MSRPTDLPRDMAFAGPNNIRSRNSRADFIICCHVTPFEHARWHRRTDTPVPTHTDVPTHRRANTPTCQHPDVPTHRPANTPTCQHTDVPTHRRANTPTRQNTDVPTHRRANKQTRQQTPQPPHPRPTSPVPSVTSAYKQSPSCPPQHRCPFAFNAPSLSPLLWPDHPTPMLVQSSRLPLARCI